MMRLGVGLALLLFAGGVQSRKERKIESSKDFMQIENSTEKVKAQLNSSVSLSSHLADSITNSSTEQPSVVTTATKVQNQRNSKLLLHLPRLEGETNMTFSDVQQEMGREVDGGERMVRIGDGKYVPFNSMTFSSRNQALQAVTEAGDTSTRTTTVPWWKKLKDNKKKGNKNKKWWNKKNKKKNKFSSTRRTTRPPTRPTERSTTSKTTRATKRPTKLSTTWFPLTFTPRTTKSTDYFKRPVVHEDDKSKDKDDGKVAKKPADAVILEEHDDFAEEDNVLKDALVNSIFTNHNEEESEQETGLRQLPTLTEVAGLFDDFYSYAEYYPWKSDVETVKKFFLKILEDFSDNTFKDRRKLMKFLQKKVYLYSRLSSSAMNKLILDEELLQRYNFIVTDLVRRKIRLTKLTKSPTTKPAAKRDPSSEKPQHAHKNLLIMNNRVVLDTPFQQKVAGDKSVIDKNNRDKSEAQKKYSVIKNFFGQKRPVVDLGPYWSSERPALRPVQFYPQTSGWPENEQGQGVAINPMFGQKPFGQESELAELFASAGGETGTGNTSCRVSLPSD